MTPSLNWQDTLTNHAQYMWQQLLDLLVACIDENLVNPQLAAIELENLREQLTAAETARDDAQLEGCLNRCKHLFIYYSALLKQKQRVNETGSSFSQLALEGLRRSRV